MHPDAYTELPPSVSEGLQDDSLISWERTYPAFSSSVTDKSRFWTISAVISISFTFLLLGR